MKSIWEAFSVEVNGREAFEQHRMVFYIQDGIYTWIKGDKGRLTAVRQAYEFRPKEGKHAIVFNGKFGDPTIQAIYELKRDDLTICMDPDGGARPDQFFTEQDDGRFLIRLHRVDIGK